MWESARHQFARLFGRGDAKRTEAAERWLTETHDQLTARVGGELELARAYQQQRWQDRFADLLEEDPSVEAELRALIEEIQAAMPGETVSAADHAVAAGRDVNVNADHGSVSAAVLHGNVTPPGPTSPGLETR